MPHQIKYSVNKISDRKQKAPMMRILTKMDSTPNDMDEKAVSPHINGLLFEGHGRR